MPLYRGQNCKITHLQILLFVLFFALSTAGYAQTPAVGSVSGKLVNAKKNEPLSAATITLVAKADNKPAASVQTNSKGNFKLANIKNGTYLLKATHVGFVSLSKDSIIISAAAPAVQVGTLKLRKSKTVLEEVQVTNQKSKVTLGIDKKTFDASESTISEGGSAVDLLANVPLLQVDATGKVTLRGSNVKVLINGKTTPGNLVATLEALPADAVERVEVITNPSSKYQADGQSGIVNIVLKKNAQMGLSGHVSAKAGNLQTRSATAELAYKNQKINLYGNYGYRAANRISNGFFNRNTTDASGSQFANQVANQNTYTVAHNFLSGIDLFLNDNNTLSFSNSISLRDVTRNQGGLTVTRRNGQIWEEQNQDNVSTRKGTVLNFNLDFEHKFKRKGELLTTNIGFADEKADALNTANTASYIGASRVLISNINNNRSTERVINLQADYTLPLENGRFEAGYRSTLESDRRDNHVDTLDRFTGIINYSDLLSRNFLYNQNVHAVYTNYQRQFGNFSIQGGLRLEDAYISSELETFYGGVYKLQKNSRHYLRLYPTLFLTQKLSESQTLQLSYSRRVGRPRNREVSPFLDVTNRKNYLQGNPDLQPEDTHSFELSYINYFKSVVLTSSVFHRFTTQNIQGVSSLLSPEVTLSTYRNLGSVSNTGYELIAKYSPADLLDVTANVNAFYLKMKGDPAFNIQNTSGFTWNSNLSATIKPTKKLSLQLRGDYSGSQVSVQGSRQPVYGMDAALKYKIIKGLTFGFNTRDVFNSRKVISQTYINSNGIMLDQVSQNRRNVRTFIFSLSFRFGAKDAKKQDDAEDDSKAKDDDSDDDADRDGSIKRQ